jgi:hypothetical protein
MQRSDGQLSDRDIVNYLSSKDYILAVDAVEGEDPTKFEYPEMYPGDFRHAISLHILGIRQRAVMAAAKAELERRQQAAQNPTPDANSSDAS